MKQKTKERLQRLKYNVDVGESKINKLIIKSVAHNSIDILLIDENQNDFNSELILKEEFYERESSKDKITYTLPYPNSSDADINTTLLEFDVLLAIDTSCSVDKKDASTCVLICNKLKNSDKSNTYQMISQIIEWDARNTDKPENTMYAHVIENIRLHNLKKKQKANFAVIIDSDLGNIESYNERSKPIISDYFLPDNFTLFYASDSGSQNISNELIKLCDKNAKEALKNFSSTTSI